MMEVPVESESWRDESAQDSGSTAAPEKESFEDQIKGFARAWGEMAVGLGRGCRVVARQTILREDSYIVKRAKGPIAEVSERLRFLNEFLPEDRHPLHAWAVILFVSLLTLAVLNINSRRYESSSLLVKKVRKHPPSAARILLPDGRHIAYQELGIPADKSRFSLIIPHGFLSSRLAGIPGINTSLLEEFGVRLISYDLPGFGESDDHPNRDLNSSALDMSHLADSLGIKGKFWVLGYSSGSLHVWAALKYIPHRIAGAAMLAPFVNPYERSMSKEEMYKTWEKWLPRKKMYYFLARRFPKFLGYFYRDTFLSGKHDRVDKWLVVSLGKTDQDLVVTPAFEEIWQRDVEESIRQGNTKPFIEEAVLQVSDWGFSPADLQVKKKCPRKGLLPLLRSIYRQLECELTGFLGPIHLWQGMDDRVIPPAMTDYLARVLPTANVHRLPEDGHLSYFFLCDECHQSILSTLFGNPEVPVVDAETALKAEEISFL